MVNETVTFGRVGSRPYGQLIINEISTSPELNQSVISIKLILKRPYNIESTATKTATCTVNGQTYDWVGTIGGRGDKVLISKTQIVPHNDDGSKTIFVSASITLQITWSGIWVGSIQGSDAITLTKIPRAAFLTQTLAERTETSLTVNWSTNEVVDRLWVSSDNGSTWTQMPISAGRGGSFNVINLNVGTEYNIKSKVRRKSNQVISESSTLVASTYNYPYATSMPNFVIGEPLTVDIFNPMGHTITVDMLDVNNTTVRSYEISNTTITGFDDTTVQNYLYMSIPNSKTGTYKIKVTYDNNVSTRTGGTYTVNPDECAPEFGTISYQDVNPISVAITQNDQQIVQEYSTVRYTASDLYARKHSTIASCSVSVNGHSYNLTLNGTTATGGNAAINSGTNVVATFTLTDSRGVTARAYKTIPIFGYKTPTATIKLQRQSNFYTATDLTVHARYSSIDGKNALTITYRARKQGDSYDSVTGTAQNNTRTILQLDNQYAWNVEITLQDSFNTTVTYSGYKVGIGIPLLFIDRSKYSVGINCFPTGSKSLEVNGTKIDPSATMTCSLASSLVSLQTDTFTTINLELFKSTNRDIFSSTFHPVVSNGILVKQPLEYIVVSASAEFFISPTSGIRSIRIMYSQDGGPNYVTEIQRSNATTGSDVLTISPFLLQLDPTQSNARIFLQYKTNSSLDSIKADSTWLTVQTP